MLGLVTVIALVAALTIWLSHENEPLIGGEEAGTPSTTETAPDDPADSSTSTTEPRPVDPEIASEIQELQDYVAEARGHEFRVDVPVEVADDATFEERVAEAFPIRAEDVIATAAYYEALGLIPEGSAQAYAEQLRQIYGSIDGFYDPETGVLLVRGVELDGRVRSVLVHELTHALDDQWFELHRPQYDTDTTTEHAATFTMVLEGDAVRIQNRWILEQPASVQAEAGGPIGESGFGATSAEGFAAFGFLAPYDLGFPFIGHVAEVGGEQLVDGVIVDPPATTEQVMFTDVFDRREGRLQVPPPPADGPVIAEGVAGDFFWMSLLSFGDSGVPRDVADAAVRGWGGDWQVSWADGALVCTRTDVEGDTTSDTQELFTALTQWVVTRPDVSVTEADGRVRMQVCYPVPLAGGSEVK